ncbi:MAG: DMT family transporter [Spirochaetia bacterium]|jgi:drug/metabolite transporter (DMT)-like permease|nr:DMT family transporter [Spirochaetia bacterium]
MIRKKHRAELMLVAAALIWGATFVIIKEGIKSCSPILFNGIRFMLAFLIMFVINRKKIFKAGRKIWLHGAFLGSLNYIAYAMQTLGLKYTSVAKSGLVTYLFAILTPPLQYVITKKIPHKGNITGLAVVFAGMIMITSPKAEGINIGDILTLASALSYAFYIVLIDIYPAREDAGVLVAIQFLIMGILGLITAPLVETVFISFSSGLVFSLAYLSILGSAVCIYIINRFQHYTTPTRAVLIYALEPMFSVFLGIIILAESKAPLKIAGGIVILSGILLSEMWEQIEYRMKIKKGLNPGD